MGDEFLNMDNILSGEDVAALFAEPTEEEQSSQETENTEGNNENENTPIAEVASELLFGEPESVGNEEDKKGKDAVETKGNDSPEQPNFFSSIAEALVEDGVFPDLDPERVKKVLTPEDFRELIEERIKSELDERQKRIDSALNSGIEADTIKHYEQTLGMLDSITPELLAENSERGEDIRKRLLLQDFLNKNFTQQNAIKMIKVLMDTGEDVEQAKLALEANKQFFESKYNAILNSAREADKAEKNRINDQAEKLKKDILNSEKFFGTLDLDKKVRQKAFDNISKPVYRDKKTGEYYTALQKYKMENENDFIKNVGLLFTLTDGFKNIDKLVAPSAKKEVKNKMKDLEKTLNNSVRGGGSFKYVGTTQNEVGKSFLDRGYTIDL